MPEFDLDNFKKTWQEQPVQEKYDNTEILQMLNKKSRNYVKYIFWISVVELLFFFGIGLFYLLQNEESNGFLKLLERLGAQKTPEIIAGFDTIYFAIKILSLLVTAYFVFKFYQNYRKIKIEENLKGLITRIIKFKTTVNAFIFISIAILIAFIVTFTAFIFYAMNSQNIEPKSSDLIVVIVVIILSTVLCVLLIWLYYKLVYGIIIRKLDKNLKQLKDIDSQEV